jgi:hypothetical protein
MLGLTEPIGLLGSASGEGSSENWCLVAISKTHEAIPKWKEKFLDIMTRGI